MRILARHVLVEFWKIFGICCLALFGIYYIVDIFNRVEIFISYDAPIVYKFAYFLLKLPLIIYQIVPVALLISIVTVLGIMDRNNELTAAKAGGINLYSLTLPLLLTSLVVSALIFVNNEYLLPVTNRQASYILDIRIKGKPPRGIFRQSRIWYAGKDNTLYNIAVLSPRKKRLEGVTLFRFDEKYHPVERIDARIAQPRPKRGWRLEDVIRREFTDEGSRIGRVEERKFMVLPLKETLDDFYKYKKDPDEMNFSELKRYVEKLSSSGFNATPYRVDLLAKTALPFISFVVVFISIALAVRGGSRGGIVASVGLCMAVGLAFWLTLSIGISLGHAGRLNPWMAAWGANILFGAGGLYFYANLRQ